MTVYSSPIATTRQLMLVLSTVLTGLAAGFFATYQYSVTRALARVDDVVYVKTFQAINATIRSTEFGIIFFGSLVALVISMVMSRNSRLLLLLLTGAVAAYAATLVITFSIHIPLNESLAIVDANTQSAMGRSAFEGRWNDMHLLRTLTVLVAFIFTTLALVSHKRS